tara:strand:+ start:50 stop:274 length:225 start_codon:yes stop_codon:yes gene_type:complete
MKQISIIPFVHISLPHGDDYRGVFLTLFNVFQLGVVVDNLFVDLSMSLWKLGIHLHFVIEEENRCLEIRKDKKT